MRWEIWIPVGISVVALLPGIYAFLKTWKQSAVEKSDVVFKNAVTLINENRRQAEENSKQADSFKVQLAAANKTIEEITDKLYTANMRADKLSISLSDANIEIIALRAQVESMSKQINEETP